MPFNYQNENSTILLDEQFLATLSEQKDHEIYARIAALDINENPIEQIEGRVTGGTINVDGNSTVRRSCNLTMICENIDINDFYWGIKTKFKLYIGLRNNLHNQYQYVENGQYPDIVWFPEGTYIVSTFNTSISVNSCTVSISGKDKMCLLNGELGGQLFASIDFGTTETLTKIMRSVDHILPSSSDGLMTKEYYVCPNDITNEPDMILTSDERYAFILDTAGNYYKDGNLYKKTTSPRQEHLVYYTLYKKAMHPEHFFVSAQLNNASDYHANEYYYSKYADLDSGINAHYFVLDTKESPSQALDKYYILTSLYRLEIEKTIIHLPIEKIIREAVHTYAKEPYYNIIINDLDDYGLEQLTYNGDKKLYAFRKGESDTFVQLMLEGTNTTLDDIVNGKCGPFTKDPLSSETTSVRGTKVFVYNKNFYLYGDLTNEQQANPSIINNYYYVAVLSSGDDIGYRLTDLTYPGDLISSIGETLTSILDKIKKMLGNFEYFYDLQGRFIFQRQRTYVDTSWNQIVKSADEDDQYVDYVNSDRQKFSFNFEGNRLISAIQNSPVLTNLRNDFTVWGKRKSVSGVEIPIHARYAIDKKPVYYKALNNAIYTVDSKYAKAQLGLNNESEPTSSIMDAIRNFELEYPAPSSLHLTLPEKNSNTGLWSAGWWDIRDWARYYKLLTGTTEDPTGTMKWYSSNDTNGCIQFAALIANNVPLLPYYVSHADTTYRNSHVWLLEVYASGQINPGHGIGEYKATSTKLCTYYTSSYNAQGRLIHTPTDTKEYFHNPYSGCADQHTYLYFLDLINRGLDSAVYFYTPNFPTGQSAQELIDERIEEENMNWLDKYNVHIVDWREILYQMALDYFAGQGCSVDNPIHLSHIDFNENDEPVISRYQMTDPDHFLYEVGQRNPYYYPTGYTGYEQYYTDMQGFWRQLYNPDYSPQEIYKEGSYIDTRQYNTDSLYFTRIKKWDETRLTDYNIDYYFYGDTPEHQLQYEELMHELTQASPYVENIDPDDIITPEQINTTPDVEKSELYKTLETAYTKYTSYRITREDLANPMSDKKDCLYWNRAVFEAPATLNFWIEFLDSDTELAAFSVQTVDDRSKVVNEDKAGAIFYNEIPGVILYDASEATTTIDGSGRPVISGCDISKLRREILDKSGYTFIYIPRGFSKYFNISYRNISVKNKLDELLYQYAYCIENITITAIPIYHLQPNTRIFVQDKNTGIEGEYIVQKITLPLTYNGTMSISASKAPERLY